MAEKQPPLEPGDEICCLHCRRWHPIFAADAVGTPYAQRMLYWTCRGARFFAGTRGDVSRHPTQRPIRKIFDN
jgi:hypothetical protein